MAENKSCYLCKSTDIGKRSGSVRDNDALEIFECQECGLVFLSSFDHVDEQLYEDSKMHEFKPKTLQEWRQETAIDDERRFNYLKPLLPQTRLLDFGCGVGGFLQHARSLTQVADGVELEKRLQPYFAEEKLNVVLRLKDLAPGSSYDVITLFHVLEHIPDPRSLLEELKDYIAENGQIIIEVPHANDALLKLYQSEPFSHFTYWSCHLFLFTVETLASLADSAGLKVNYIKQIQRYGIANHMYWLAKGKPGGHKHWAYLDDPELHQQYEKQLASIGQCDTLIASLSL